MEYPTIPIERRRSQTIQRSEITAGWVQAVADALHLPLTTIRAWPRAQLEQEIARLVVREAESYARRLVRDDAEPPDGDDLFARVVRARYVPLKAARDAALNAEAERRLSALL
jgi:hypothetical protein